MGKLNQAEFLDKRFENPLIKTINAGEYDKSVVRDIFDVLVKHDLSYEIAPLLLFRTAHLIHKQQDNAKVAPLSLDLKAK